MRLTENTKKPMIITADSEERKVRMKFYNKAFYDIRLWIIMAVFIFVYTTILDVIIPIVFSIDLMKNPIIAAAIMMIPAMAVLYSTQYYIANKKFNEYKRNLRLQREEK